MKPTIRILPDADQLARFTARLFVSRLVLTNPIQPLTPKSPGKKSRKNG